MKRSMTAPFSTEGTWDEYKLVVTKDSPMGEIEVKVALNPDQAQKLAESIADWLNWRGTR
jgi:hypothetical protein